VSTIGAQMQEYRSLRVGKRADGRVYVEFRIGSKRYRYSNGDAIDQDIKPNYFFKDERLFELRCLRAAFKAALDQGWRPRLVKPTKSIAVHECIKSRLKDKLSQNGYSLLYKRDLTATAKYWDVYAKRKGVGGLLLKDLSSNIIMDFLVFTTDSETSRRSLLVNLSALIRDEILNTGGINPFLRLRLPKSAQRMHFKIDSVYEVLDDIGRFDKRLWVCCIMTYGLLLRPHREIRCLRTKDFNENFTMIHLDGSKTKGKRNRTIPVSDYIRTVIRENLPIGDTHCNIFTGEERPYAPDFFKGLWTKYKRQSKLLEPEHTLYSFRHSGAIDVYTRTGSLTKLQQVMGHSSLQVSLTYLRGLEVKQLDAEDMPILGG
jgi:integrase